MWLLDIQNAVKRTTTTIITITTILLHVKDLHNPLMIATVIFLVMTMEIVVVTYLKPAPRILPVSSHQINDVATRGPGRAWSPNFFSLPPFQIF